MNDGWIEGQRVEKVQGIKSYLEIICNKAVDNRIHAAIQTAESNSQVVDNHMMRHIRVEVHHHLHHKIQQRCYTYQTFLFQNYRKAAVAKVLILCVKVYLTPVTHSPA